MLPLVVLVFPGLVCSKVDFIDTCVIKIVLQLPKVESFNHLVNVCI